MNPLYRLYLSIAFAFLILSIIILPYLKPGSPSFIVNILGITLLLTFILMLILLRN